MGIRLSATLRVMAALVIAAAMAIAQPISDAAKQQIEDILAAKRAFTHDQLKVGSNLMFASLAARGRLGTTSFSHAIRPPELNSAGLVTVDIKGRVTPQLL